MEMNAPIKSDALDVGGIVGQPLDRVDGRLKVTGGARYAYEYVRVRRPPMVSARSLHRQGTDHLPRHRPGGKAPGVILVLTYNNAPEAGSKATTTARPSS